MVRAYATEIIAFVSMLVCISALILAAGIACNLVSLDLVERLQ
jgi:hypothetical protein